MKQSPHPQSSCLKPTYRNPITQDDSLLEPGEVESSVEDEFDEVDNSDLTGRVTLDEVIERWGD